MVMVSDKIKEEIWTIRTIDLTRKAHHVLERLFWLLLAISGTVWFFYFMSHQVKLWNVNKIVVSKLRMKLSDLNYPAVTFCSESVNKYGVAEQLGNHLDAESYLNHDFLAWIRKYTISCSIDDSYNKRYLRDSTLDYPILCLPDFDVDLFTGFSRIWLDLEDEDTCKVKVSLHNDVFQT